MTEHIKTDIEDGICTITINRPAKKNALLKEMYQRMADVIKQADTDPAMRVILITGSGGNFSAGNDLQDFLDKPPGDENSIVHQFLLSLAATNVPLVAAVEGMSVGVGTTMLLHCDFVYAHPDTRFILPFINLALVPEASSSLLLPQMAGYHKAAELLMLGEPFDVNTARDIGLVSAVCEPAQLLPTARATAAKLAGKSRSALRHTKALLRRPAEPLSERMYAEMTVFMELLKLPASREIMTAFVEKRKPDPSKLD